MTGTVVRVVGNKILSVQAGAADNYNGQHTSGHSALRSLRPSPVQMCPTGGNKGILAENAVSFSNIPQSARHSHPSASKSYCSRHLETPAQKFGAVHSTLADDPDLSALHHLLMRFGDVEPWDAAADVFADFHASHATVAASFLFPINTLSGVGAGGGPAGGGGSVANHHPFQNSNELKGQLKLTEQPVGIARFSRKLARSNRWVQKTVTRHSTGKDACDDFIRQDDDAGDRRSFASGGECLAKLRSALGSEWNSMGHLVSGRIPNTSMSSGPRTIMPSREYLSSERSTTILNLERHSDQDTVIIPKHTLPAKSTTAIFKARDIKKLFPPLKFPQSKWVTSRSINPKVPILDGNAVSAASQIKLQKQEASYQLKQKLLLAKSTLQKSLANVSKTLEAAPETPVLPQATNPRYSPLITIQPQQQEATKLPKVIIPKLPVEEKAPAGLKANVLSRQEPRQEPRQKSLRVLPPRYPVITLPLLHEPLHPLHNIKLPVPKTQRIIYETRNGENADCNSCIGWKGPFSPPQENNSGKIGKGTVSSVGKSGCILAVGVRGALEPITGIGFKHVQPPQLTA